MLTKNFTRVLYSVIISNSPPVHGRPRLVHSRAGKIAKIQKTSGMRTARWEVRGWGIGG